MSDENEKSEKKTKPAKDGNQPQSNRVTRRDELEAKLAVRLLLIDRITNLIRVGFVCVGVCFVAYMIYRSIEAMAGRSTDFRSVIDWAMRMNASEAVTGLLIAALGMWGYTNHRARKKMAQQAGPRLRKLEEMADPDRTSSGLTSEGANRPEDNV